MKKVTWLLGLSLLLGGGSVFAQSEQTISSYEELKTAMDFLSSIPKIKADYNALKTDSIKYEDLITANPQYRYEYTAQSVNSIEADEYIAFVDGSYNKPYANIDMYYTLDVVQDEFEGTGLATVIYASSSIYKNESFDKSGRTWKKINLFESTKELTLDSEINRVQVYYLDRKTNQYALLSGGRLSNVKNLVVAARSEMPTLASRIPSVTELVENKIENPNYKAEWGTSLETIKKQMGEFYEDFVKAEYKVFKKYSIEADIEVSGNVPTWTFPVDFTINGNGHVISGSGAALFATNNGEINNLVVSTGLIARNNNASITNSIARVATGNYIVYNAMGAATEKIASLEDAAYALRDIYGYDMKKGEIAAVTAANKLYQAKYANAEHKDVYSFKVNIDETESTFKYNESLLKTLFTKGYTNQNAVIYIDETDVPATVAAWQNVAVRSGNSYTCANTVMEEGNGVSEFYIPFGFTSSKLTYNRDFKQDLAAVCLPFALTSDDWEALGIKYTHQFKDVNPETNTMWFSYKDVIPANEPCIITFNQGNNGTLFAKYEKDIKFEATAGSDLGVESGNGERDFYGSYARTLPGNLSANGMYTIYGIQGGRLVKAPDTSYLNQFRSYVRYKGDLTAEAPSFRIGLLDENDNEIATGVESVSAEKAGSFKVMGGNNAIEVSTDKACDVKVYAVNGTVVKSVRVEAGNTSLPVKAGVYVVNGIKVIVK